MIIFFEKLQFGRQTFKMSGPNIFQTPYSRANAGVVRGAVRRRIVSPVDAIESSYARNLENLCDVPELPTPSECTPNQMF